MNRDMFNLATKLLTCFHFVTSLPIYLSVLAFLCRPKHQAQFTSSFYTFFIALGFVDISKFVLYIVKKCSYWGCVASIFYPVNQANRAANLVYFLMWTLALIQFQFNFLMSLNRFCAICCFQMYRYRWTPKVTQFLLAFVVCVALAISAPILWQSVCFRSSSLASTPSTTSINGPVFTNISTQIVYYNVTKIFAISHLIFLIVAYPLMCRRIRQTTKKVRRSQIAEIRMCYALVLPSIANLLYAIYLITWDILSFTGHAELAPIAEWSLLVIIDFYDMNSPYGLIITSAIVRNYTLPMCLFQRWHKRSNNDDDNNNSHSRANNNTTDSGRQNNRASDNAETDKNDNKKCVLVLNDDSVLLCNGPEEFV